MRNVFLMLIISFLTNHCLAQNDCSNFKVGKFIYTDSAKNTISVTRKKNKQIEFDIKNKITTKLKIKWISDCEYQLTQTWSSSKAKRKQGPSPRTIVIIHTYENNRYEYTCKCTYGDPNAFLGTMIKVN